jgi:hypothetical protein
MSTTATRSGRARVFLHPTPADGPHPGYRGEITADVLGVHLQPEAEFIVNDRVPVLLSIAASRRSSGARRRRCAGGSTTARCRP